MFEDRSVIKMVEEQVAGSISARASEGIGDTHELWVCGLQRFHIQGSHLHLQHHRPVVANVGVEFGPPTRHEGGDVQALDHRRGRSEIIKDLIGEKQVVQVRRPTRKGPSGTGPSAMAMSAKVYSLGRSKNGTNTLLAGSWMRSFRSPSTMTRSSGSPCWMYSLRRTQAS